MSSINLPVPAKSQFNTESGEWEIDEIEKSCQRDMIKGASIWGAASLGGLLALNAAASRFTPLLRNNYILPKLIIGTIVAYGAIDYGAGRASSDCVKRNLEMRHGRPVPRRLTGEQASGSLSVLTGVQAPSSIPFTFRDNTESGKGVNQMQSPNPRDEKRDAAMAQLPKAH